MLNLIGRVFREPGFYPMPCSLGCGHLWIPDCTALARAVYLGAMVTQDSVNRKRLTLRERVQALAEDRGDTIEQVASRAGMRASGLHHALSRERWQTRTLERIALALDISVSDLLRGVA